MDQRYNEGQNISLLSTIIIDEDMNIDQNCFLLGTTIHSHSKIFNSECIVIIEMTDLT